MSRQQLIAVCLVSSLLVMPAYATSQQVAAGEAAQWHDMAERLEPAAFIAVRLKDGKRIKGTLVSVSDTTLTLKPKTRIPVAARDIAFDNVVAIERAGQGTNPGQKVLVGAGAVVGGTLLVLLLVLASID